MTRWLKAAKASLCQTDQTDRTDNTARTPHPAAGSPQQHKGSRPPDRTPKPKDGTQRKQGKSEVLSVLSVCQFDGKPLLDPAAAKAMRGAFEDYAATNDPHDPRAWA